MKKSLLKFSFIFAALIFFSSCTTTSRAFQSSTIPAKNVELDPIKADIKVDNSKKLTGESSSSYLLFFRLKGDDKYADGINFSTEAALTKRLWSFLNPFSLIKKVATGDALGKVKRAAAYKALEGSDADILVHPTYTITEKSYLIFYVFKAEVKGYAGKYQNFRTEKPQKTVIIDGGKEFIFSDK
jgi:hypothetical protein